MGELDNKVIVLVMLVPPTNSLQFHQKKKFEVRNKYIIIRKVMSFERTQSLDIWNKRLYRIFKFCTTTQYVNGGLFVPFIANISQLDKQQG